VNASAVPGYTAYGVHFMGGTGPGVDDTLIRKLAYWDWTDYMNIWIVNKNDGPLSGYAGFPFYSAPSINSGVIISAGNATADNSTLVHELGHCLGLYHTFEGDNNGSSCPSLTNCTTTGDMICDTEPDKRFSDCSATINPCTGAPYNGVQFNFMNYSGCTAKFTPNQRDRMQYYLATFWNKLRYSRAGDSILTGTLTPASCITTASSPGNTSSDGPLRVSFNGIYRVSQGYNGDGNRAYVDNTCSYRTQVVPGGTYGLAISVSGAIQKIRAYIDYNNDGVFQVPAELVYSTTTSRNTDTVQTSIIIPTSGVTLNKPLRMRIVSDLSSNSNIGPCGALLTGQAEDYALVVSGSAGVNSGFQKRPGVYPNPANRYITIEGALGSSAILMNVEGQRVMQFEVKTDRLTVDIAPLPMGNYILQFTDAKGNRGATRIVKQ
jgi:hypothetical protein